MLESDLQIQVATNTAGMPAAGLYFCVATCCICILSAALLVWLVGQVAPAVFLWLVAPYLFAAPIAFLIRTRWLPSLVFLVTTLALAAFGSYLMIQVIVVNPDPQGGIAVMFTPVVQWAISILGSLLTAVLWLAGVGQPSQVDEDASASSVVTHTPEAQRRLQE